MRYCRLLGQTMGFLRRPVGARMVPAVAAPEPGRAGQVTHLLVAPWQQGRGVGRALLATIEELGRQSGLDDLVLVTLPGLAAGGFYERLGWSADGAVTSRSGEQFVRYRYRLG